MPAFKMIDSSTGGVYAAIMFIIFSRFLALTQQTQNICIAFVQRRPSVFDVGPTLYKCYTNVSCLLGSSQIECQQQTPFTGIKL